MDKEKPSINSRVDVNAAPMTVDRPCGLLYLLWIWRLPKMQMWFPESWDGVYLVVYGVNGYTKIYAMR